MKMARLHRAQGLTPAFVWLPMSILEPQAFYDHHLLCHVYLALFVGDGGASHGNDNDGDDNGNDGDDDSGNDDNSGSNEGGGDGKGDDKGGGDDKDGGDDKGSWLGA